MMKKLVMAAFLTLASTASFALPMGSEAVEMVRVMSHPQVVRCLEEQGVHNLVSLSIEKLVGRCFGCNSYQIEGLEKSIDMITAKKKIDIVGKMVPGAFGMRVQTYTCSVETENL